MRGTTTYRKPDVDVTISVSEPAARLMGDDNVPVLVRALTTMMEELGAETAYVSKRGAAVDIHILRSDGWRGHMTVHRKKSEPDLEGCFVCGR